MSASKKADARVTFRRPKILLPVPTPALKLQKVQPGVPDTQLTREATGLLHEFSTPLLFNHSHRVFFWANELGRQAGEPFDAELLFVCAAFHDLGLLKKFSSADDRFEVDSANAVRQFLEHHDVLKELANGVRAVYLEPIVSAAELLQQAEIMKGCADEYQLSIERVSCLAS